MDAYDAYNNLKDVLGNLEYHTQNLKKAIEIAKKFSKEKNELDRHEEKFVSDCGYAAERFNAIFEEKCEFDMDKLFEITGALDDYNKSNKE